MNKLYALIWLVIVVPLFVYWINTFPYIQGKWWKPTLVILGVIAVLSIAGLLQSTAHAANAHAEEAALFNYRNLFIIGFNAILILIGLAIYIAWHRISLRRPKTKIGLLLVLAAIVFWGLVLLVKDARAQSLSDPAPLTRSLSVRQFGLPRDAQYIFCPWSECRERTVKTLAGPKMAAPSASTLPPTHITPPFTAPMLSAP